MPGPTLTRSAALSSPQETAGKKAPQGQARGIDAAITGSPLRPHLVTFLALPLAVVVAGALRVAVPPS